MAHTHEGNPDALNGVGRLFAEGVTLNVGFVIVEGFYGWRAGSLGVVAAGVIYLWLAWTWIDPVVSLVIAAVIITSTWSQFKESLHLLFDGVPKEVDARDLRAALLALPGVQELHDLHGAYFLASEKSRSCVTRNRPAV